MDPRYALRSFWNDNEGASGQGVEGFSGKSAALVSPQRGLCCVRNGEIGRAELSAAPRYPPKTDAYVGGISANSFAVHRRPTKAGRFMAVGGHWLGGPRPISGTVFGGPRPTLRFTLISRRFAWLTVAGWADLPTSEKICASAQTIMRARTPAMCSARWKFEMTASRRARSSAGVSGVQS